MILAFILHDSKIKGKKFSSDLLTFGKRLITKCIKILSKNVAPFFITKREQNVLQNAAASLLQNASMLFQNAAGITKRVDYYKTWHNKCELLQFVKLT